MTDFVTPRVDTSGAAPAGHDASMIAKVDAVDAALKAEQQPAEAPKLAGKFATPADLEKAYLELEKKMGSSNKQQAEPPKSEMTEDKAAELVQNAGLDVNAMANHFNQNGSLTPEHYAALEKAGIPKAFVDQYIEGVQATVNQAKESILSKVGGEEQFQAMAQWAKATLTPAELDAYNRAVDSNDLLAAENAVLGLAYRYQSEMGKSPKLIGGQNAGASAFQSVAQLVEAMKDPRYAKDPAYRRDIEQRLAASNIM